MAPTNRSFLLAFTLLAFAALTACSQNEFAVKGPAPAPPQDAREAKPVQKEAGAGMNPMPSAPEPSPEEAAAPAQGSAGAYSGTVEMPPALAPGVKPGSVLFVFARSVGGDPAPVAAIRLQAAGFPVTFTLTEANAMMGGGLPAEADLFAKVDADGNVATAEAGDFEGGPVRVRSGGSAVIVLKEAGR